LIARHPLSEPTPFHVLFKRSVADSPMRGLIVADSCAFVMRKGQSALQCSSSGVPASSRDLAVICSFKQPAAPALTAALFTSIFLVRVEVEVFDPKGVRARSLRPSFATWALFPIKNRRCFPAARTSFDSPKLLPVNDLSPFLLPFGRMDSAAVNDIVCVSLSLTFHPNPNLPNASYGPEVRRFLIGAIRARGSHCKSLRSFGAFFSAVPNLLSFFHRQKPVLGFGGSPLLRVMGGPPWMSFFIPLDSLSQCKLAVGKLASNDATLFALGDLDRRGVFAKGCCCRPIFLLL